MSDTIRIRTTPLDSDKYIKLQINQDFDFLEILSLKIGQDQAYRKYCSDYGVIAGRVVVNGGVGVPNAKVSVFIPISDEDLENPTIREIYPFETIVDRDSSNKRYNLLSESPRQDDLCHKAVGTFPQKRRILDCEPWCEVYGKYYKYTTSTNASGDYMIFGVPTGVQNVHMDVDLSDMGYLSQKPYDMVGSGSPPEVFDHLNEFKVSDNIDELPQIKTQNQTINVQPFWGDLDQCVVGINRVDFDLNYTIKPTAFFIGSIWGDSEKNSINKNCQVRRQTGYLDQMVTGPGTIEMIRKTPEGGVEAYSIKGDQLIDDDGTWIVQLPMNLDNVITDEFGNLIPSGNPEVGLPTKAKYRFRIGMNDYGKGLGRHRSRAHYLVPNWGDYTFDDTTAETTIQGKPNYATLEWNGIYTVKEFIARYSNTDDDNKLNFVGIKQVQEATANNPFPFNKFEKDSNPLFRFLCVIMNIFAVLIYLINSIIINLFNGAINILNDVPGVSIGAIPCIKIDCVGQPFCPGCSHDSTDDVCNDDLHDYTNCLTAALAEALDIFSFYFSNDWIVGGLFSFLFKFKIKGSGKHKFCNVDYERSGAGIFGNQKLFIRDYNCAPGYNTIHELSRGVIKESEEILYYASNDPVYPSIWLFPTDIYNLGSMKSCDFLGKPKLITEIPTTTFNIPEIVNVLDTNGNTVERGIDNLLMNINCVGVSTDQQQCTNIYRFCEYGVSYNIVDDNGVSTDDGQIDDNDIESEAAYVRSELECMNVPSICSSVACNDPIDGKFGGDWMSYRTGDLTNPGGTYFSESRRSDFLRTSRLHNSFYFYFGLLPGKSSIDKIKSQYFAECERFEPCPIAISGSVENNHCIGGTTGSITLSPLNGTPPYKYDWYYDYPSAPTPWLNWTNDTLPGLAAGAYTVVVKDNVGQKCKKTFTVYDPSPFEVKVEYSKYVCPPINGQSFGYISVLPIGGFPPYNIQWLGAPYGSSILPNTGSTFYLTGLFPTSVCSHTEIGVGGTGTTSSFYNFIVKDSGDVWGCPNISGITVDITQSCGIALTADTVNDFCSSGSKGSITVGVNNGGVSPYTFVISNSAGYSKTAKTSNDFYKFTNLSGGTCPGINYDIRVIDNCGTTNTISKTILKSSLRYLGYHNLLSMFGPQLHWYLFHYSGPASQYTHTSTMSGPPYWHGSVVFSWNYNHDGNQPNDYWYELPPIQPGSSAQIGLEDSGNSIAMQRTNLTNDVDRVLLYYNGNPTSIFYDICKNETYSVMITYADPGSASAEHGKSTIKSVGCSDVKKIEFT